MFDFLFNVSAQELRGAVLQFGWPTSVLVPAMLVAVGAALLASGYLSRPYEPLLAVLRGAIALILVLVIAQPHLQVRRADSTAGAVAVLTDSSASMSIIDAGADRSRADAVQALFDPDSIGLAQQLQKRFDVRWLRYAAEVHEASDAVRTAQVGDAISDPLRAMLDTAASGDVSALVLVSDGGQISGVDERELLMRLQAMQIPVHVLGVGDERVAPDLSVRAVLMPTRVLDGDEVDVRVQVAALGLAGTAARLVVFDNDGLVGEQTLEIDVDDLRTTVSIPVTVQEPGLHRIEVRADVAQQDRIAQNNTWSSVLNVRSDAVRVLHFEAEPRFEVKFVRRALAGDTALSLVSLVRTGDNRYLRLGIESEAELAQGFPNSDEELFRYQVLIIGSAKVASFSPGQLQLLERFVRVRGGSVLFLGGRGAFAEGGWGAEEVARLLPVQLQAPNLTFNEAVRAQVTQAGRVHPVTRGLFDGTDSGRLLTLPALAMVNPVRHARPGASVLLHADDGSDSPMIMLAWHRYGAGRVAALPVRDTWRWQMHADVPLDDRTHELFWRRLVRWLAREVPDRVTSRALPAVAAPGQHVQVEVVVRDERWQPLNEPTARLSITTATGEIVKRDLTAQSLSGGVQNERFVARDAGVYQLAVTDKAASPVDVLDAPLAVSALMVRENGEEFLFPELRKAQLQRFAAATGGSYRHLSAAGDLIARIAASVPGVPAWHRVPLWNAPIVLLTLLLLACSEWWYRRQRRQLP